MIRTATNKAALAKCAINSMSLLVTILACTGTKLHAQEVVGGKTIVLPAGTTFEGRIDKNIGSAKSHQGERFAISLASAVFANGSDVLIPTGSQVLGEVVEAVSSGKVPHSSNMPKPIGKLRIQLTALRLPDGMTFPMVASLVPDSATKDSGSDQQRLGSGLAYVGSQGSFDMMSPNNRPSGGRGSRGPHLVTRSELMNDPIMGTAQSTRNSTGGAIRSLVKKGRDYIIYSGSPLTIRIDAPFKIAFSATPATQAVIESSATAPAIPADHHRFRHEEAASENNADAEKATQPNSPGQAKHKADPNDSDF